MTAIINYIRLTQSAPTDGPAIVIPSGQAFVPLSTSAFMDRLREELLACGECPSHFGTHSFRRGGASWALQNGLSTAVVRILGDWKTDSNKAYIDLPFVVSDSHGAFIRQRSPSLLNCDC